MFVPQKVNLTIYQGTTFARSFAVAVNGAPIDMTGWSARMQIKETYDDEEALVTLTTKNGGLILDVSTSQLSIYILPSQTSRISSDGVYDLELVDASGAVGRLIYGKIKASREVTTYGDDQTDPGEDTSSVEFIMNLEFEWVGTQLAVRAQGSDSEYVLSPDLKGEVGDQGQMEFQWDSDRLGVRNLGSAEDFVFSDSLKGESAESSSGGGLFSSMRKETSSIVAAGGDLVLCDASGGGFLVELPLEAGITVVVRKTDETRNAVSISCLEGLVGGREYISLTEKGHGVVLICDGLEWIILLAQVSGDIFTDEGMAMQGSGSSSDPYIITNIYQLQEMSKNLLAYYALGCDIDAAPTQSWNNGAGFEPIGTFDTPFKGGFDGRYFVISNLFINRPAMDAVGFIGYSNWEVDYVRNTGLLNANITGGYRTGAFFGRCGDGPVDRCWVSGSVVSSAANSVAGGFSGQNHAAVTDCFSLASVQANLEAGGFTAFNNKSLTRCFSTGSVPSTISKHGGLIATPGHNTDGVPNGSVLDSFWDTETSGQTISGAFDEDGIAVTGFGGTGKTTIEMKSASTFTDLSTEGLDSPWDFEPDAGDDTGAVKRWAISSEIGGGYPHLYGFYNDVEEEVVVSSGFVDGFDDGIVSEEWSEFSTTSASDTSVVEEGGTLKVSSSNTYALSTSNKLFGVMKQGVDGDFIATVKVLSAPSTNSFSFAGIVCSNDLTSNTSQGGCCVGIMSAGGKGLYDTSGDGLWDGESLFLSSKAPYWVRLKKTGLTMELMHSETGEEGSWTVVTTQVPFGASQIQDVGLAVASGDWGGNGTAEFDDFSLVEG